MTIFCSRHSTRRPIRTNRGTSLFPVLSVLILAAVLLLGWGPAAMAQHGQHSSAASEGAEMGGCGGCGGMAGEKTAGKGMGCQMGSGEMAKTSEAGDGHGAGCCGGGKQAGKMASGQMKSGGMGAGKMGCKGMGAMGAANADAGTMGESGCGGDCPMHNAMSLVHQRSGIERQVEEIEGGIRSVTTAANPATADLIEHHVRQVAGLIENGGRMRSWDPLFKEIFDHYEKIDISIERIDNGVIVEETSDDPWVAELIRAHADKVNQFLARGPAAVHEATPLPERPVEGEER